MIRMCLNFSRYSVYSLSITLSYGPTMEGTPCLVFNGRLLTCHCLCSFIHSNSGDHGKQKVCCGDDFDMCVTEKEKISGTLS